VKRLYSVTVRGREKTWGLPIKALPEHVEDWRADGLEVDELINTIPVWIHGLGLTRPWCAAQDFWNRWLRLW
jgi:hypothetical protein